MANYRIEISATAERQIRKLRQPDKIRVLRAIMNLAVDPRPRGCRKLRGFEDIFRIRTGTYRILYSIESRRLLILVLKIGHRKDIYR